MRAPRRWEPSRCRSVWRAVLSRPAIEGPGDYREWNWDGVIRTRAPQRRAICAACGEVIPVGTPALHVVDSSVRPSAWLADERYLHRTPCIPEGVPYLDVRRDR